MANLTPDNDANVCDFVTVPAGIYVCRIAEVRVGMSRAGAVRWSLRLVVAQGEQAGKQAAWESLLFSKAGLPRARKILRLLGVAILGDLDTIEPRELEGLYCRVQVEPCDYASPSGDVVRRNEVTKDGWLPMSLPPAPQAAPPPAPETPIPDKVGAWQDSAIRCRDAARGSLPSIEDAKLRGLVGDVEALGLLLSRAIHRARAHGWAP